MYKVLYCSMYQVRSCVRGSKLSSVAKVIVRKYPGLSQNQRFFKNPAHNVATHAHDVAQIQRCGAALPLPATFLACNRRQDSNQVCVTSLIALLPKTATRCAFRTRNYHHTTSLRTSMKQKQRIHVVQRECWYLPALQSILYWCVASPRSSVHTLVHTVAAHGCWYDGTSTQQQQVRCRLRVLARSVEAAVQRGGSSSSSSRKTSQ